MRRRLLIGVAVLVAVIAGAAGLGGLLHRRAMTRVPSSFAPDPEGLLGFRRLLEELAVPSAVWSRPWDDLRDQADAGLVILATPLQREIDAAELEAMRTWLIAGGALFVVDDATVVEESGSLDALLDQAGLAFRPPLADLDLRTSMPSRPPPSAAQGTAAAPAGRDLRRLMLHRDGGLLPQSFGTPLAISPAREIVAAEGRIGSGRVILVQGALLANDALLEGDALTFALRIVADARRDRRVLIDEYHHGYGGVLPVRGLDPAALGWAAVQAVLVTLIYAGARGVRFGQARAAPLKMRRSSLEFVRSMAALYQRGRARGHALEILKNRFEREARNRWDLPGALTVDALARACAARTPVPEDRVRNVFAAVQEAIVTPGLSEHAMVRRAAQIESLEKEVFRGHREGP